MWFCAYLICFSLIQLVFVVTIIEQNVIWTPSKLIARLGKEIDDKSSYLYWAYKVSKQSSVA